MISLPKISSIILAAVITASGAACSRPAKDPATKTAAVDPRDTIKAISKPWTNSCPPPVIPENISSVTISNAEPIVADSPIIQAAPYSKPITDFDRALERLFEEDK